jgi:putative transposase
MFQTGTRYMYVDNEYIVRKEIGFDIEVENLSYKKAEIWSREELLEKWMNGEITFRLAPEGEKLIKVNNFNDLEPNFKEIAMYRYSILKPVIEHEIQNTAELIFYLNSLNPKVSKSVFYDWKKKWDLTEDIRALVPVKTGPKKHTINDEVMEIIDEVLNEYEYRAERFATAQIHSEVILRIREDNMLRKENKLKEVSFSTVHRRRKQKLDQYKKDRQKHGSIQAKLNKEGVKQEIIVKRPLERVEIDWTRLDVMLIDPSDLKPKRPWLVYGIDRCTGYPLGFIVTFKPVDSGTLKQLMLHIVMPKNYVQMLYPKVENEWLAYGIPKCVVVDNASVNDSYEFEDACYQLGIEDVQFCTVGAGHQKPAIERAFRTLNSSLVHTLQGTTFSNIFERGLYDSEGKACITIEAFIYMAHLVLVDLIANSYSSKRGDTPSELWKKGIYEHKHISQMVPRNIMELKLLMMEGSVVRTIQPQGVVIENEFYYSQELIDLKTELEKNNKSGEVRVRYDTSDMRRVYVFDRENNNYIVAEQTGFDRKEIDANYPTSYIRLQLVSKTFTENKKKVDPTLRAQVSRKVEQLKKESSKEVAQYRKNKDQARKEMSDYVSLAIGSEDFSSPNNEEITISYDRETSSKKNTNKTSTKSDKVSKEDPSKVQNKEEFILYQDNEVLPTFKVKYKSS